MAVFLTTIQLVKYSQIRANFPRGLKIGGVYVGELDYGQASERLLTVYLSPIEVHYGKSIIQIKPVTLGFEPKLESMLAAADNQRVTESFWVGYWKYLWNQPQTTQDIPLQAFIDVGRIRSYLLEEISPRYDEPAIPPIPIPGESGFYDGIAGTELDIDRAVLQIIEALKTSSKRSINLTYRITSIPRPPIELLQKSIIDIIDTSGFDGIVELYLQDLQTSQTLNFAYSSLSGDLPKDIAYSSWSTIKIPVMVSAFRVLEEPASQEYLKLMEDMIDRSDNESTDALAITVIEKNLSPLIVTKDMQTLGLKNTFWGGHFYLGAPLLQRFTTPANQRQDIDTEPDIYAQTTPSDMGHLLQDIYFCAEINGGSLVAAFNGEITQSECKLMVQYLAANKIGVLFQAGVPGGTTVAHKHGWANESDDGYIHTIGDVAIIYTPGGNYILSMFVHHPVQAIFDPVNLLFANISSAAYNYFNLQKY
ncbi:MAG: class A beta-lactamase-related serine hydrolase [Anaerolineaceae bacterium]|nr:class A beta-lactamase-related serine hydrolase [Anaerolineaceae bacterium]